MRAICRRLSPLLRANLILPACEPSRAIFTKASLPTRWIGQSITGDIVETWLRLGEGRPTLVYGVNRRHAQHIAERFVEAGVAAEYMDAYHRSA